MAIIQNHFYRIVFLQDDMMKIMMKIEKVKDKVYPQTVKKISEHIQGVEPLQKENPYQNVRDEINHLIDLLSIEKQKSSYLKKEVNLQDVSTFIKNIEERVIDIKSVIHDIHNEKNENNQAVLLLNHLKQKEISLDDIHKLKYITLRFGKIPMTQIDKIDDYQNEHFIMKELSRDKDNVWVVYCALNNDISKIDNIFSAINFKEIVLPDFAHGKIDDAIIELHNEQTAMEHYIDDLKSRIEKIKDDNKEKILSYFYQITYLNEIYADCRYVVDLKDKAVIYVFSPCQKKEITDILNIDDRAVIELPIHLYDEKNIEEPILLKNNHFIQPFEKMIKFQSGDRIDPTGLVTTVMMLSAFLLLGDLGVGVTLILLSVIIKGKYTDILQRIGLAILTGGLFTARIFYQNPIYQFPLLMPQLLSIGVMTKFMFFIGMNLVVYLIVMIVKNISRKMSIIKGGV